MKKVLAIIVLALIASLAIAQKSITFVVDENLAPIEESNKYLFDGERLVNSILYDENIPKEAYHIVATSFADAQCMKSTIRGHFPNTIVRGIGSLEDQLVSSKVSKPQKAKNAKTVKSGDKMDDIDYFVCHQSSTFTLKKLAQRLDVTEQRLFNDIVPKYGNSSSATIPVTLCEHNEEMFADCKMKKIMFAAFGTGMSVGAVLMDMEKPVCKFMNYPNKNL